MRRVAILLLVCLTSLACASLPEPHPTADHPIHGCYISCKDGYLMRRQHLCRGEKKRLLDIEITGEDDVPGDPSESRWFTGLTSFGADYLVNKRLENLGLRRGTLAWAERYSVELQEVKRELGDEARAAYNKQDVELTTCAVYIARICNGVDGKCSAHPGEPDPKHPDRTQPP